MRKTLLVTDIPPCKNYTAGLVLDQLCRFFKEGELACYVILNKDLDAKLSPDLEWIPTIYHKKPHEGWGGELPGFLGVLSSLWGEFWNTHVKTQPIVDSVVAFGKNFKPDVVWCVLQGQTMIRVTRMVARGIDVPLVTQIWDPPGWWMRAHRVNRLSRRKLLGEFAKTLQDSACCFAASEAMARKYSEELGTDTEFFYPSLDSKLCRPPATAIHSRYQLVIAMAGQLYSLDEWHSLLATLDNCNWKVEEREVMISLIGSHEELQLSKRHSETIKKHGWLSQTETIQVCSEADILYCPYWFSVEFEEEARLSFPSKLTTYLAAGRPVFSHSPEYASSAIFLKRYKAGFFCHSTCPKDIMKCLSEMVQDATKYAQVAHNGNRAFMENMTVENMQLRFINFIDVD